MQEISLIFFADSVDLLDEKAILEQHNTSDSEEHIPVE